MSRTAPKYRNPNTLEARRRKAGPHIRKREALRIEESEAEMEEARSLMREGPQWVKPDAKYFLEKDCPECGARALMVMAVYLSVDGSGNPVRESIGCMNCSHTETRTPDMITV